MDAEQITENFVQDIRTPIAYEWVMDAKFKIAINLTWKDKITDAHGARKTHGDDVPSWLYGREVNPTRAWMNTELTLDELARHVQDGHAIAPQLNSFDGLYRDNYESFDDIWKNGGYRSEGRFVGMNWVAVDIDEGYESIDQIAGHDYFKQYGCLLYTSASHTPEHPKARLVFAFEETLTDKTSVRALYTALIRKFGGDEQCKDAARMFFGAVGCEVRKYPDRVLPDSEVQKLIRLGSIQFADAGPYEGEGKTTAAVVRGKFLPTDTQFTLKDGSIVAFSDVTKQNMPCFCPLPQHGLDKKPGAFLSKNDKGNYFVCKKCSDKAWWMEANDDGDSLIEQILNKKPDKNTSYKQRMIEKYQKEKNQADTADDSIANTVSFDELLEFSQEYEPYSWEKRENMLRKQYKLSEDRILLYAAEGFGKSSIVKILVEEKDKKVVFACKSNVQAEEQAQSFRDKYGLNVQLICARDHWLRTLENVEVEYYEAGHPWDSERVNETRTKLAMKRMGMDNNKIEKLWEMYRPPVPDFHEYDIVVTTQARVMGWGRKQYTHRLMRKPDPRGKVSPIRSIPDEHRIIPKDAVIICDDGQMEDFCMLADFDNKYLKPKKFKSQSLIGQYGEEYEAGPTVDGRSLERKTVGDHEYFVRPKSFLFGFGFLGFGNQIIFSTTEHLTRELIFRRFGGRKESVVDDNGKKKTVGKVYEPKLIPDHHMKMNAGKITVFKTFSVQKKNDGILPVIAERVRALWDNDIEYIADGQGCALNHVTIKGQNTYSSHDLIIEISYAHMHKVTKLLHELEWDEDEEKNSRFLKVILALDTIHQAIGRNTGYRFADRPVEERGESVVLLEPGLFKDVLQHIRYKVTHAIDLDNSQTRFNRSEIKKCFPTTIGWYIKNIQQYLNMQGGRTFLADAVRSFQQVGSDPKHPTVRQFRLLESMKTILTDIDTRIQFIREDSKAKSKDIAKGVVGLEDYAEHVNTLITEIENLDLISRN